MKDIGTNSDKNILTVVSSCYQLPTAVKSTRTSCFNSTIFKASNLKFRMEVDIKQM